MKTFREYRVISRMSNISDLEKEVNAYISVGWQPLGGICATIWPHSGQVEYYQAMVR